MPGPSARHERLVAVFRALGGALLGYSGGVDSTLLLAVGSRTLGERLQAVTVRSAFTPRREIESAREVARALGARHAFVDADPLAVPEVAGNPRERCYHCKRAIFSHLKELAAGRGLAALIAGDNLDDLTVYRPGRRALEELGVRSPLVEAGFTKDDVRALSRELGLPTADAPTLSCLATRFPYDTPLSVVELDRTDRLEEALLALGFVQVRVRRHGEIARVEVPAAELARMLELREAVVQAFKAEGIRYVTLDLEGFRSGSMD